jgi:hypothetical protein
MVNHFFDPERKLLFPFPPVSFIINNYKAHNYARAANCAGVAELPAQKGKILGGRGQNSK